MSDGRPATLTNVDVERLGSLLATRVGMAYRDEARRLRDGIRRAIIVPRERVPADVVTMNSTVVYEDLVTNAFREATLVYPWRASERGALNILTEIGLDLLGRRVGEHAELVRIVEVRYQPEAQGHWHL
jgi:regulator of nucleoside diphosphate kinase